MYKDWDCWKDNQFDRRIYIPEKCKATFNMHGHLFNRNNVKDDDYSRNGELLYVELKRRTNTRTYSRTNSNS